MTLLRTALVVLGSLVALASACGGETAAPIAATDFDRAAFGHPTDVDNTWLPLRPGTQLVLEGSTREEGKRAPRREVFIVTDLAKVVNGVRTIVVWDRDWKDGRLDEGELSFFAQDDAGNVWHLGEYPEVYEDGKIVEVPAWLAGVKGAKPGVQMRAKPETGAPDYSQGYAPPPINWVDRADVHGTGGKTCVPQDCYDNVLLTREFEPGKPDAYQLKYYAPGVGNIRVGWTGARDVDHEVLRLVDLVRLDAAGLEKVRAQVRAIDERGFRMSKDVYGSTSPVERLDVQAGSS